MGEGQNDDTAAKPADALRYWGKARSRSPGGPWFHPLPYHSLDVAAVMAVLCTSPWGRRLIEPLGPAAARWLPCIAALHDLGKFARGFQNLAAHADPRLVPRDPRYRYGAGVRHDSLGLLAWRAVRAGLAPWLHAPDSDAWEGWMACAVGHHGQPPKLSHGGLAMHAQTYFAPDDLAAAAAFAEAAAALLVGGQPIRLDALPRAVRAAHSWAIAGLFVLADWLGSNQRHFQYVDQAMPLEAYWRRHALPGAEAAVQAAGLVHCEPSPFAGPAALFAHLDAPTPLQALAATVPLAPGPQLFILEDVTGAGKTEAALILAQRLMAAGAAHGLYFGLPTMATANQMFRRVGPVHRKLFADGARPNLVLAHGSRHLVDDFRVLPAAPADRDYLPDEPSASGSCSAWLGDSSKKALLAEVGVGTLDQALLAVLRVRHQSLRMLGLAGKVLVLDEVHAFFAGAPYTGALLRALLRAHAQQGGSAILLSATLPAAQRHDFVNAFRDGAGHDELELPPDEPRYPLLTHEHGADGPSDLHAVASRPEVSRTVGVEFLHDEEAVLALIREAARAGRAVVWIRNTVDDAREAWQRLRETAGLDPERITLFHSRYALADRLAIEDRVLDLLGSGSTAAMRRGQIVVATAVLEVGLDIDADVLVCDHAPIDALLQRAGRLHRHVRDAAGDRAPSNGRPPPVLHVLAPVWADEPDAGWYARSFRRAAKVYRDAGRLWLTQRVLRAAGGWCMPGDARRLIEGVYGPEAEATIPKALEKAHFEVEGQGLAEQTQAGLNGLELDRGYSRQSGRWDDEDHVPTRLTEDTAEVVLLRHAPGDTLAAWAAGHPHSWDASTVKVPERVFRQAAADWQSADAPALEALRAAEPRLQYSQLLVLRPDPGRPGIWRAEGEGAGGRALEVRYDAVAGWRTGPADA